MNELVNKWYRNHALIYKLLLLLGTTFFIVYLFPKTGKFRYSFEKGKPWQSENLYAPFDFAIKKTDAQIDEEVKRITDNNELYFELDLKTKTAAINSYLEGFNATFEDSITGFDNRLVLYNEGKKAIENLYKYGILNSVFNYDDSRQVILIENNEQKSKIQFKDLFTQTEIRPYLQALLKQNNLQDYEDDFISLFYIF